MAITFDPRKDAANFAKHGLALSRAADMVMEIVEVDGRVDYGEVRYRGFGMIGGIPHCLAFTATTSGPSACVAPTRRSTSAMSDDPNIEATLAGLPEPDLDDPDNPEWTEADFARARPAEQMLPPGVMEQFARPPGRPRSPKRKVQVTLRLDPEVLDHFKLAGAGWQSRINEALKKSVA